MNENISSAGWMFLTVFHVIRPRKSGQFDYVQVEHETLLFCLLFSNSRRLQYLYYLHVYGILFKVSRFNLMNWASALEANGFVVSCDRHTKWYLIRSLVTNDIQTTFIHEMAVKVKEKPIETVEQPKMSKWVYFYRVPCIQMCVCVSCMWFNM